MKLKLALLAGAAAPAAALYGAPRPVQIIPSVLPADFAALGLDCTALEKAGCDRIQQRGTNLCTSFIDRMCKKITRAQ